MMQTVIIESQPASKTPHPQSVIAGASEFLFGDGGEQHEVRVGNDGARVAYIFGCSASPDLLKERQLTEADPSAYEQYRIFAVSCILRCIGAFDAAAQKRLMDACPGAPYATGDEALNDFESSESITEAQVEWIDNTWRQRKNASPNANPHTFAEEVAPRVFSEIDF